MSKSQEELQQELYKSELNLCKLGAISKYRLLIFGDYLAKRQGYKEHERLDAIHFYLIEKYHWLPSQVKSLNDEDLGFLLKEEMSGWTVPEDALE